MAIDAASKVDRTEDATLSPSVVVDPIRLAALDDLAVLDTPAEARFDDVVRLATRLCAAPVALVSFVASDRQWFKARIGFPRCETDLDSSVCKFALVESDLLVIGDLSADPRTYTNPLVTGRPNIRFYAGAPLRLSNGQVVGSLCVIDTVPRPNGLTAEQAEDLRALGRQVSDLLEMRRAVEDRDQALGRQRAELRRARRIDVLAKASQALLTATDPAAVLDPILSANAGVLGFDRSYTYDLWPDNRHLRLTHSLNATVEVQDYLRRMPYGAPLCGIVAEKLQSLVLEDLQTSEDPRFQIARGIGLDAYAGFPVMSRGSLRGVISFASTKTPAFDEEALTFFETLARLMSAVYERLDGEIALRESDTRARLAQEAGQVGTFEVDVASGLMSVSPEFARLYGVPATALYSAELFEALVLPEDRALSSNETSRQAGTAALEAEYRIRRADDGALRWVSRRATFARDEAGVPVRMYGTVQDITDRHLAQEALRASDERFRTIVDTIEAAFAIVEVKFDDDDRPVDYRFVEANPAFERQSGVNLQGKWVTEFAPDLERFWFDTYGHVAKTGEPANFENYAEAFKRWFDVRAVRVGNPDERRIAILFNDVTARKTAEAALRASEAVARANVERVQLALAAGAIIGTWFWDLPSDRFAVDEAFARSFGLDPALGREGIPLAQIVATVHPDDQAGLAAAMDDAITRGGAYAHQYRVRRDDGLYYWVEANGRVDRGPDGRAQSFPGVLLDVEERRAAQEALQASESRFRALVSAGAQSIFRVSPDWREMRAIDGADSSSDVKLHWLDQYVDRADRAGAIAAIDDAVARKGIFEFEHRARRADGSPGWTLSRAVPILDSRGEIVEWFGTARDITDRVEAEARRDALLRLGDGLRDRASVGAMALAACETLGATLGVELVGYGDVDPLAGTITFQMDRMSGDRATLDGAYAFADFGSCIEALKQGETVVVSDRLADSRTAAQETRFGRAFVQMPVLERGSFVSLLHIGTARAREWDEAELAFIRDVVTRLRLAVMRVQWEEERDIINEEMSHRLKNMFAMVLSIAGQTLRGIPDRAPVEAFEQRIHALSSAHDVLLRQSWAAAPAQDVVTSVLANAGHADRIDVSGPDLDLGPRATLSLSLILHELSTNAVKYGALSVPNGRVAVSWRLSGEGEDQEVVLQWVERGGPPVTPPVHSGRKGFGSRLINMGLVGTGGVSLRYLKTGFEATMCAPLVHLQRS